VSAHQGEQVRVARSLPTTMLASRPVSSAIALATEALYLALRLSLPALGVAFSLALLLGFLQSATKLGEPALVAIPRALAVGLCLAFSGAWLARELLAFTARVLSALPDLVH
jgi:flagellar biosynthetic protein FliQ